ncbi:MAG TPA: hypothetical protein VI455_20880 [Terriglobia bacterium]
MILDIDIDPGPDEEVTGTAPDWKSRSRAYPRPSDTARANTLEDAAGLESEELDHGTHVRLVVGFR